MYQTGASIQPTLGFSVGNFSLTAWGSTDFDGTSASAGAAAKEIDLTVAYTLGRSGLTVSVADLWWAGQGARKYFNFKSHETAHHFEAGVAYTVQSKHFLCLLHGIPCLQGKIRMRRRPELFVLC